MMTLSCLAMMQRSPAPSGVAPHDACTREQALTICNHATSLFDVDAARVNPQLILGPSFVGRRTTAYRSALHGASRQ